MNPKSEMAVDARAVARRFGSKWVLRGFSAQIRSGEIVALMGANGSGKTTLLRILATLLRPSAGGASIYGRDVAGDPEGVRQIVNYLSQTPGLYEDLTARENLGFAARMSGIAQPDLDAALEAVGLGDAAHERVRGFSSGMQRRVALARLMLRPPRLFLLDEPYNNLDSAGAALVNEVLQGARRAGAAAVIVLHDIGPAAAILDRAITIEDGKAGSADSASSSRARSQNLVGAIA